MTLSPNDLKEVDHLLNYAITNRHSKMGASSLDVAKAVVDEFKRWANETFDNDHMMRVYSRYRFFPKETYIENPIATMRGFHHQNHFVIWIDDKPMDEKYWDGAICNVLSDENPKIIEIVI